MSKRTREKNHDQHTHTNTKKKTKKNKDGDKTKRFEITYSSLLKQNNSLNKCQTSAKYILSLIVDFPKWSVHAVIVIELCREMKKREISILRTGFVQYRF